MLNIDKIESKDLEDFQQEVAIMKNLRNSPHLVMFVGYSTRPMCLITEFCEKGSLLDLLTTSGNMIPEERLHRIIIGIVKGKWERRSSNE